MINEPAYIELTLEVLATFHMHQGNKVWNKPIEVYFPLFGHEYHLSYMEFALYLALYDHEYITTDKY